MSITRRQLLATMTASTALVIPGVANAAETVRIGLPTKTYWPTTIAETAVRQKLFEKEGIGAELTIYRGGAETFEAMAAGVSVIATTSEGAREIIEPNQTGMLAPIGDIEAMAKAITSLLNDASERERLSQNAADAARRRFSLQQMVAKTEQVYAEVIAGQSA